MNNIRDFVLKISIFKRYIMPTAIITTPESPWTSAKVSPSNAKSSIALTGTSDQTWIGFGGCFNEIGWNELQKLSLEDRSNVLKAFFDQEEGCKFNFCRMPIGANDYALSWYSLNESDGDYAMENFSIERDKGCLIPYIKAAQAINPNFELFASPWSPPSWMKMPKAYNYGKLVTSEENLKAYALYFKCFVEAYASEGIKINEVHVQNEPNSDQKFPSCVWTGAKMRDFIRDHLGPLFEKMECSIGAGTIERDNFDSWAMTIMNDPECRKYIASVGYQWAGKGSVQRTHQAWPDMKIIQTENECCAGENSWQDAEYVYDLFQHYITNGVSAYTYWNMVLQPGGESTWGWHQNAMVTVENGKAIYNPEFYVMKHHSHFIQPGAIRQVITGHWAAKSTCFKNPDGSLVYVLHNPFETCENITLFSGSELYDLELPAHAFATVQF